MTGHLTPTQFAAEMNVCPVTVRRWLKAGRVRGKRVGPRGNWWIPAAEVHRLRAAGGPATLTPEEVDACVAGLVAAIRGRSI